MGLLGLFCGDMMLKKLSLSEVIKIEICVNFFLDDIDIRELHLEGGWAQDSSHIFVVDNLALCCHAVAR